MNFCHLIITCFVCDVMSTWSMPCSVAYASEMCDVLNQDLFSACHEYLSPTSFHQQCRSDTCKCGTPCLCSVLAHYARHCRRFSIIVDFRSHLPDCGEFSANWHILYTGQRGLIYFKRQTLLLALCWVSEHQHLGGSQVFQEEDVFP